MYLALEPEMGGASLGQSVIGGSILEYRCSMFDKLSSAALIIVIIKSPSM